MNTSTSASNVIPFNFQSNEVRTVVKDGEPWFVATDVAAALGYSSPKDAASHLDDDEKGSASIRTPGGEQRLTVINESGLYALVLRSRKPEARKFAKWVTSEVLPAIRKHGRYEDTENKLGTLMGEVIGSSGELVLSRVIEQKASPVHPALRRRFAMTMKSRLRSRFNVQKTALIPAESLPDACNFVAAYALEGEWIPAAKQKDQLSGSDWTNLNCLLTSGMALYEIFYRYRLYEHFSSVGSPVGSKMIDHIKAIYAVAHGFESGFGDKLNQVRESNRALAA